MVTPRYIALGLAIMAISFHSFGTQPVEGDEWDKMLQGITIEEKEPEEVNPPSKSRPKHIRSNYQGLEKPGAPVKGTTGQMSDFQSDSKAASAEAVDAEMQLMTETIDDLIPPKSKPVPVDVPTKPPGLTIITLSKDNFYNNAIHEKLKFKLDVNNAKHTQFMMSYLANRGQDGWTWEQKDHAQSASLTGESKTEIEVWLEKPSIR